MLTKKEFENKLNKQRETIHNFKGTLTKEEANENIEFSSLLYLSNYIFDTKTIFFINQIVNKLTGQNLENRVDLQYYLYQTLTKKELVELLEFAMIYNKIGERITDET